MDKNIPSRSIYLGKHGSHNPENYFVSKNKKILKSLDWTKFVGIVGVDKKQLWAIFDCK